VSLRFELYEYMLRSAEPKGRRVVIWSDIELVDPADNHKHWRDFLRAYKFELDLRVDIHQAYILEATCRGPDGKRLTAEFTLKPPS